MEQFLKKHRWELMYAVFLTSFTIYLGLDTFVLKKVYATVEKQTGTETDSKIAETEESSAEATVSDSTYKDENIEVAISHMREYDTSI